MAADTTTPFPHVFVEGDYGVGQRPKMVDELDIIKLMNTIRDKPDWENKIKDPEIVGKWRQEAHSLLQQPNRLTQVDKKIDYVLAELEWVASTKDGTTGIEVSTVDGTFQSDILVDESLRKELIAAVQPLETVPDSQKDWHPGSNGQVLDLVHPSLFPLIIGKSPILRKPVTATPSESSGQGTSSQGGKGDVGDYSHLMYFLKGEEVLPQDEGKTVALAHTANLPGYAKSAKFQWLPSAVIVSEEGKTHFTSYVNNLHPERYPKLYNALEKILTKFIPMFEKVLSGLRSPRGDRMVVEGDWYEERAEEDEDEEFDNDDDYFGSKVFKPVTIPDFVAPNIPSSVKLNGKKLQVIVKLANIHLTPESPEYPGGVWHVEGMGNERIVASGIYYYSCDNITESRLLFRRGIREPDYEQYDTRGVDAIYNLHDEEALNQEIGSILTKDAKCIAFPNTYQHKVAPFKLQDTTRPGHRKILVFFLVDPNVPIIATDRVPPQQKPWFLDEIEKQPGSMPDLVMRKIVGFMDFPLDLEEAKKERGLLMDERKFFIKESNESFFERPFSLCEH